MPHELAAALCLLLVIEGLLLLVAPRQWQHMVREALQLPARTLRVFGAVAVAVGLVVLQLLR
ncbi:MAG TPA: DUF2065 family protein [Rhodanobacter sp.]|jgi:uncharacterized protein|nr:DUF2065 family protein [Rhodanobacter sp.]